MTTGQPIRFPSDRNKYNNEYAEALQLQIDINQTNLEVNRLYKQTGQLPASTQMIDTRSNEEKLMDVEYLKQQIISDLRPIAEPMFASAVVQGVLNSPLNVNNSLYRYLAQNAAQFAQSLSKRYKFGIAGDANDVAIMIQFLEDAYNKTQNTFQSIKGYINSNTNLDNARKSNVLSANDTDNIINELKDILQKLNYIHGVLLRNIENGKKNINMGNRSIKYVTEMNEKIDYLIMVVNKLIETQVDVSYIISVLPTTQQMSVIIDNIQRNVSNDIENEVLIGSYSSIDRLYSSVVDILRELPKLQSLQTLSDRLMKAIKKSDLISISQNLDGMKLLFVNFNTNTNNNALATFKNQYIDQAQQDLENIQKQSEINSVREIKDMNIRNEIDKRASRVYVVNPADDAVYVRPNNQDGNVGMSSSSSSQYPPASDSSSSSQSSIQMPPQMANAGQLNQNDWTAYVTNHVNTLSDVELDALFRGIPNNANLRNIGPLLYLFNDPNASRADKENVCSRALILNFGNAQYGPHANVGNILRPGLGLGIGKKGRGLYSPFGDIEINHKNLDKNILTLRRKSKTNYMDLPSKHISKHVKSIVKNIIGGKIANYEDIEKLNDDEKEYLNKVISKSNLHDRLSVPAPSKDQSEKDNHQWEVMRGEIMAGNDSHELVKKFKLLTMKLTRQGLLPKNEVMELFEDLVNLGY